MDMEITTNREGNMERKTFNRDLITGLWKIRHTHPQTRPWLRQCITIEKNRRG